jgi:YD repeat-containing protein
MSYRCVVLLFIASLAVSTRAGDSVFVDGFEVVPVITSVPVTTAFAGQLYTYDVEASDPDGDSLTYSLKVAPDGMSIDPVSGLIQWTPDVSQAGAKPVTVRATDPGGLFASQAYTIDVTGVVTDYLRPEVTFTALPGVVVEVGTEVTLQVVASDDTAVVGTALLIENQSIPLDEAGFATFSSPNPGVFEVLATAQDAAGNQGVAHTTLRFIDPDGDTSPPICAIASPQQDGSVTSPVDVVGTATDETAIMQYSLQIARTGTDDFHVIDQGETAVSNDVLGQFDPTLVENGLYHLRLVCEDTVGNTSATTVIVRVEGQLKLGRFSLGFTDLDIPTPGLPLRIERSYDSLRGTPGDFGVSWDLEPDIRVDENGLLGNGWEQTVTGGFFPTYNLVPTRPHLVLSTYPDGSQDSFGMTVAPNSQQLIPFSITTPVTAQFPANPGTASMLAPLDGTVMYLSNGAVGPFIFLDDLVGLGNTYDPTRYRITLLGGTQYDVNQVSGLQRIADNSGNILTFGPGGIIHNSGDSVTFTRNGNGRITSITNQTEGTLFYEYDVYDDLVAYTDGDGNKWVYLFDSFHRVTAIVDGDGIAVMRIEYDPDGRRIAEIDADGNRTEYEYDIAARKETITDPSGNITVIYYDDRGNVVSVVDDSFDEGNGGWVSFQNSGEPVTFQASGGNPGGHVLLADATLEWAYLQAPARYLETDAYGGELSFDLLAVTGDPGTLPFVYEVKVGLQGAGLTLINAKGLPTSSWVKYSFPLLELSGWRIFTDLSQDYDDAAPAPTQEQMMAVMADLSGLYISADHTDGSGNGSQIDETAVDNVRLESPP